MHISGGSLRQLLPSYFSNLRHARMKKNEMRTGFVIWSISADCSIFTD